MTLFLKLLTTQQHTITVKRKNEFCMKSLIDDKNVSSCLTYKYSSSEFVSIETLAEDVNKLNVSNFNACKITMLIDKWCQ